jgi:hypothetical protein
MQQLFAGETTNTVKQRRSSIPNWIRPWQAEQPEPAIDRAASLRSELHSSGCRSGRAAASTTTANLDPTLRRQPRSGPACQRRLRPVRTAGSPCDILHIPVFFQAEPRPVPFASLPALVPSSGLVRAGDRRDDTPP